MRFSLDILQVRLYLYNTDTLEDILPVTTGKAPVILMAASSQGGGPASVYSGTLSVLTGALNKTECSLIIFIQTRQNV